MKPKTIITQEMIDTAIAEFLNKGGGVTKIKATPDPVPDKEVGYNYLRTLGFSIDSRTAKSLNVSQRWVPNKQTIPETDDSSI